MEPPRKAMALYRAKAIARSGGVGAACGIIACSSEVIGPDSLASVEIVPVREAMMRAANDRVSAKTAPAAPITRNSAA